MVYVPQCHSTNTLAAELDQDASLPEGTLIITDHQTAGRGQRGNAWESEQGKNLTFSLVLKPSFLSTRNQFLLSKAIAVGIANYVAHHTVQAARIKWPNDIIVAGRKIAGVLIENHLNGDAVAFSIAGIGLNINQQSFSVPQAASIGSITGKYFDLSVELEELLCELEASYLGLKEGRIGLLEQRYLDRLYGKNELRTFGDGKRTFQGEITGVNEDGKLIMTVEGSRRTYGVKEVQFL